MRYRAARNANVTAATFIPLAPAGRDLVLGEMCTKLGSEQGVVRGVQAHDAKQAAAAARASGMNAAVDLGPGLMAKLPLDFRNLGMSVHRDLTTWRRRPRRA
jgi:hypothetical protein